MALAFFSKIKMHRPVFVKRHLDNPIIGAVFRKEKDRASNVGTTSAQVQAPAPPALSVRHKSDRAQALRRIVTLSHPDPQSRESVGAPSSAKDIPGSSTVPIAPRLAAAPSSSDRIAGLSPRTSLAASVHHVPDESALITMAHNNLARPDVAAQLAKYPVFARILNATINSSEQSNVRSNMIYWVATNQNLLNDIAYITRQPPEFGHFQAHGYPRATYAQLPPDPNSNIPTPIFTSSSKLASTEHSRVPTRAIPTGIITSRSGRSRFSSLFPSPPASGAHTPLTGLIGLLGVSLEHVAAAYVPIEEVRDDASIHSDISEVPLQVAYDEDVPKRIRELMVYVEEALGPLLPDGYNNILIGISDKEGEHGDTELLEDLRAAYVRIKPRAPRATETEADKDANDVVTLVHEIFLHAKPDLTCLRLDTALESEHTQHHKMFTLPYREVYLDAILAVHDKLPGPMKEPFLIKYAKDISTHMDYLVRGKFARNQERTSTENFLDELYEDYQFEPEL